jgi:hypothetical protein
MASPANSADDDGDADADALAREGECVAEEVEGVSIETEGDDVAATGPALGRSCTRAMSSSPRHSRVL